MVSYRGEDASPVASLLDMANHEACDWSTIWSSFCKRASGENVQGYWPYEMLMPVALQFATRVRVEVWRLLAQQKAAHLTPDNPGIIDQLKAFAKTIASDFKAAIPGERTDAKQVPAFTSCELKSEHPPNITSILHAEWGETNAASDGTQSSSVPLRLAEAIKAELKLDGGSVTACRHLVHFGTILRIWRIALVRESGTPGDPTWHVNHILKAGQAPEDTSDASLLGGALP
jgi:hypothetical protein